MRAAGRPALPWVNSVTSTGVDRARSSGSWRVSRSRGNFVGVRRSVCCDRFPDAAPCLEIPCLLSSRGCLTSVV